MTPAGAEAALLELLNHLRSIDYRFVSPTPATHARVIRRPDKAEARDLRDVFGWSLRFRPETIGPELMTLLAAAEALEPDGGLIRSRVRVSSLGQTLVLHSAYPTEETDAVFFGPDSYRFARLIELEITGAALPARIVDIGGGAGAGLLTAAVLAPGARLTLTDVNPKALRLARINAGFAGVEFETVRTRGLKAAPGPWDLILANPPYILDHAGREYRDGGALHGAQMSLDWASEAMAQLGPGGRFVLYSGSAIIDGSDPLLERLAPAAAAAGCDLDYRELDPDVFGEELERADYADVERIAVVAATLTRR